MLVERCARKIAGNYRDVSVRLTFRIGYFLCLFLLATGGLGPGEWTEIRFAPHLPRVNMLPKNAGYSFSPAPWGL